MLRQENNRLIREFDSEQLWIEPWGQNSLRVRVTKMRSMPQAGQLVLSAGCPGTLPM